MFGKTKRRRRSWVKKRHHPNRLRNIFDLFTAWKNVTIAYRLQNNACGCTLKCVNRFIWHVYINTIILYRLNGHVAPICFTTVQQQKENKRRKSLIVLSEYWNAVSIRIESWSMVVYRKNKYIFITAIRTYGYQTSNEISSIYFLLQGELMSVFATIFNEIEFFYFDTIFEIDRKSFKVQ